MPLNVWFRKQGKGSMTKMMWDTRDAGTPVSWATICRAKRGAPVSEASAKIISEYTGGKVSVPSLVSGARRPGSGAAA